MHSDSTRRQRDIEAQIMAGVDPKIGEWPGDPGYKGPVWTHVRKTTKRRKELKWAS